MPTRGLLPARPPRRSLQEAWSIHGGVLPVAVCATGLSFSVEHQTCGKPSRRAPPGPSAGGPGSIRPQACCEDSYLRRSRPRAHRDGASAGQPDRWKQNVRGRQRILRATVRPGGEQRSTSTARWGLLGIEESEPDTRSDYNPASERSGHHLFASSTTPSLGGQFDDRSNRRSGP
jgi:hypothetical protein